MNATQETLPLPSAFTLQVGCHVECFGAKQVGVVVEIYEAHCSGRIPVRVVRLSDGAEMMPFIDECRVIKPYISYAGPRFREISDDTAARFAAYARTK